MENLSLYLGYYADLLCQFLGAVVVVATILAKITPSKEDDGKVNALVEMVHKLIAVLPTLGVNPETKKLKEKVEELKKIKND